MYGLVRGLRWCIITGVLTLLIIILFVIAFPLYLGNPVNWFIGIASVVGLLFLLVIDRYIIKIERRLAETSGRAIASQGFEVVPLNSPPSPESEIRKKG